jgi:hypothetical protein
MRSPFARVQPMVVGAAREKSQLETAIASAIHSRFEMFDDEADFAQDIERYSAIRELLAASCAMLETRWAKNHADMPVIERARAAVARAEQAGIR